MIHVLLLIKSIESTREGVITYVGSTFWKNHSNLNFPKFCVITYVFHGIKWKVFKWHFSHKFSKNCFLTPQTLSSTTRIFFSTFHQLFLLYIMGDFHLKATLSGWSSSWCLGKVVVERVGGILHSLFSFNRTSIIEAYDRLDLS